MGIKGENGIYAVKTRDGNILEEVVYRRESVLEGPYHCVPPIRLVSKTSRLETVE